MGDFKQKIINNFFNFFISYFWALAIFIVIILSAILYFFIIAPKFAAINGAFINDREKITEDIDGRKEVLKKIKIEKKIMETVDNYNLRRLNSILPKEKDAIAMTQVIGALVEKAGFITGGLNYVEIENDAALPQGVKKFNISLTVNGAEYAKFKSFLKMLASNAYLMDVTSIGFSGKNSYRLDLNTYYK